MSVSTGNPGPDVTMRISDASISAFRIVQGDTTDTTTARAVALAATANTQVPLGVTLAPTVAADEDAPIRTSGIALVEMNGDTVDIGSPIVATTAGKGAVAPTADATARWLLGHALAPSAADGDVIPVLIGRGLYVKGTA